MYTALMALHILVCLAIIFIILIQKSSRGAEMGAAFGGSSQTIFGAAGALTFLNKMTTVIACLFMITSLMLTRFTAPSPDSSIMSGKPAVEEPAPLATPPQESTPPAATTEQAQPPAPVANEQQAPAAEPITNQKEQAPAAQPSASQQAPAPAQSKKAAEPAPAAPAQNQPVEKPAKK